MKRLRWTLPFLFAALFWSSFHPLNLGPLGFVALVPLIVYAQVTSGKKSFFVAWAGGYVAFAFGYSWFAYTVPVGPWLVAIYMGLWIAIFVAAVRRLGVLWSPVLWLATEVLRSTLFGGLPWLLLGYTQHDAFHVIQIADLGGIWLVSLLVAFVNAALVHPGLLVKLAAGGALALSALYGAVRVGTIGLFEGPEVAVVQPNIPQSLKYKAVEASEQADENYRRHMALTELAARGKPDLIVWPEAAIYRGVVVNLDGPPQWLRTKWFFRLCEPARMTDTEMVIGALVVEERTDQNDRYANSAIRVTPEGVEGRYDKIHLVPFAENVGIFRGPVRFFSHLHLVEMTAGQGIVTWDLKGYRYGAQICYEAIFPEISREIARKGAAFTVNISNDGWFKASGELDQILAMARFRSIENRIHVIRATNTGISAFIDPTGRIQSKLEVDGQCKEVEGVLAGRLLLTRSTSLYRTLGDWVAWLGLAAAGLGWAGRIFVDRKKRAA
jgi:apolipoprotein N-acyltransferase